MSIFNKKEQRIKWENKYTLDESRINSKIKINPIKQNFFSIFKIFIFAIIFNVFLTNFIIINAIVPTSSMRNTINPNDKLIASRLYYIFSDPKRFDIIIFKYPDNEKENFVKRVIGLPLETVEIINGKIYINNSEIPLNENYLTVEKPTGDFGPYKIPENHYFVLGDNRNDSKDSRYWENTFVSRDKIIGKVLFKYYPKFSLIFN